LQNASQADQANLLLHEQGHHDIIGLIARDLCRKLLSISLSSDIVNILQDAGDTPRARLAYVRRDFAAQANSAGQAATAMRNWLENTSTQDGLYESETNHGQNQQAQTRWNDIFRHARGTDTSLAVTLTVWGYSVPAGALI